MTGATKTLTQTISSANGARAYTITVDDRLTDGLPRNWFRAKIAGCATPGASGPDADEVMKRAVAAVLTGYYDEEIDYWAAKNG